MSKISADPYVFFKGNAREALEFYQGVFGGKAEFKTFDDFKMEATGDLTGDNIMHGWLSGGDIMLMVSDGPKASSESAKTVICLGGEDEKRLTEIFERLSEGVEPEYPLKKEVWGDMFGSLRDKYGVEWMVNIESKQGEQDASSED